MKQIKRSDLTRKYQHKAAYIIKLWALGIIIRNTLLIIFYPIIQIFHCILLLPKAITEMYDAFKFDIPYLFLKIKLSFEVLFSKIEPKRRCCSNDEEI